MSKAHRSPFNETPKANIIDGIHIRIGGNAGRTNGLSWNLLEDLGYYLQELIKDLAKYSLQYEESPIIKDFDIELFDFTPGSAVPAFRLVSGQPSQTTLASSRINVDPKIIVANTFDSLLSAANEGDYDSFFKNYTLEEVSWEIAEDFYKFTTSVGNSPMSIVKPLVIQNQNTKMDYEPVYDVKKFNKQQITQYLKPKVKIEKGEPEELLGLIRKSGKRNKIVELYEGKDVVLSFAPLHIVTLKRTFNLHSPLQCEIKKDEDHFIIKNDMLDLYATGDTIDAAEFDFYNEFSESYDWFQSKQDSELSGRLQRAKIMMMNFIDSIENHG
jgi:hypothetical protein